MPDLAEATEAVGIRKFPQLVCEVSNFRLYPGFVCAMLTNISDYMPLYKVVFQNVYNCFICVGDTCYDCSILKSYPL